MEKAAKATAEVLVDAAVKNGVMDKIVKAAAASGVLDQFAVDTPQYQEYQTQIQEYAEQYEKYATTGEYASIVCGTLGVCLTLVGRNKTGNTLIIFSVPMGYFSYNANKVYENLGDGFAKKLIQHMYREDGENKIDQVKLKETLMKGTVYYDPFIEFHARHFIAHIESLKKTRDERSLNQ